MGDQRGGLRVGPGPRRKRLRSCRPRARSWTGCSTGSRRSRARIGPVARSRRSRRDGPSVGANDGLDGRKISWHQPRRNCPQATAPNALTRFTHPRTRPEYAACGTGDRLLRRHPGLEVQLKEIVGVSALSKDSGRMREHSWRQRSRAVTTERYVPSHSSPGGFCGIRRARRCRGARGPGG